MKHNEYVNQVAGLLNLGLKEKESLRNSQPAKIITALPHLAECKHPERTALINLLRMAEAHRDTVFDATPGEGLGKRMFDIAGFRSGNEKVIRYGIGLLELASLEDHQWDIRDDAREGKYNPIHAGEIDYKKEKGAIRERLRGIWKASSTAARKALSELEDLLPGRGNWL
jgi:hypothetical protein